MSVLPFSVWLGLSALVAVQLAVLVPVIVTQRAKDEASVQDQLQGMTNEFASRLNQTIASFMYNVVRAAAAAPLSGFLSQRGLEDAVQPEEDPRNTPATLYFWVPFVSAEDRGSWEQFYGFNITHVVNNTVIPYKPFEGELFAPLTVFVPPFPRAANPLLIGLDLFSLSTPIFRNVSRFLIVPSALLPATLVNRTENNYGVGAVTRNKYGKGFMFGRIGGQQLLEFSLNVPRQFVTLATFVLSTNATRQVLFYDVSPLLGNVTNVATFNVLPARSQFQTANFSSFDERIMVAVRYDQQYAAQFGGNTWIILVAVLVPVCFLIDVIFVILALFWQRRKALLSLEKRKRKDAQMMISYVNHEIRNPLQTILGLADLELEKAREEENHRLSNNLSAIVRAAEFIEHIATDILDLRRVEEGKVELEMSDVDIDQFVSGLERTARSLQARREGVDFKVNVDIEIRTIQTDRYRLEQILLNFLTNAFKHTEKGLVTLSVSLATGSWVRFAVWDTGKGIPSEKKANLFQQFAQVSKEDASSGFGLGLYLTKMLVELLGGRVGFESTLGLGSVFWVDLPLEWDHKSLSFQFQDTETRLQRVMGLSM